jgi:hypothetical protein
VTVDLVEFLLQRVAEDETGAKVLATRDAETGVTSEWLGFLPGRGSFAARVLAECEATRQTIKLYRQYASAIAIESAQARLADPLPSNLYAVRDALAEVLRIRAAVYNSHPDYPLERTR